MECVTSDIAVASELPTFAMRGCKGGRVAMAVDQGYPPGRRVARQAMVGISIHAFSTIRRMSVRRGSL